MGLPTSFVQPQQSGVQAVELPIPPLSQSNDNRSYIIYLACRIPKQEVASVKNSITGLLAQGHGEGAEASGSSRCPTMPKFKFGESFIDEDIGTEDVKKMTFVHQKVQQKGKLSMDPMVELSWKSTNYSAPAQESISLVGKSTGMLSTTSGGLELVPLQPN